jgi:pantothenate kinase type III
MLLAVDMGNTNITLGVFDGKKLIFDGNNLVYVKSAEESAKAIDAQLTFKELAEAGLSHRSAKESAGVFQEAAKKHSVDLKNELSAKYTPEQIKQAKLKRELKAKYADKLNNK